MDTAISALTEQLRAASAAPAAAREPLRIRAGGSKDFYGNTSRGRVLDPRPVTGIVSYQPSELVITARCGTSLAEVETLLDGSGQMLAFEPPHFGPDATLGGCVAAGIAGPRRAAAGSAFGAVRDFLLGATLLDGRGQLLKFGGTVMKNVAGYDVSRLLAGSLGTLGVLVEVSLKVLPKPAAECTLQWELDQVESLLRLRRWARQPLPVSASLWVDGRLSLRLAGAAAAVSEAQRTLGGELLDAAAAHALWHRVREQTHDYFSGPLPLWRLSLPPAVGLVDLAGAQLIEWGGAQRWLRTAAPPASVRDCARQLGGHATLFRGGERAAVFAPLTPVVAQLHRRLRAQFDPLGIFDGGRMYAEL